MNWRKGLWRLWLALSLCWIVAVGVYFWKQEPWIWSRQWEVVQTDPKLIVDLGGQRVTVDRRFLDLSPEEKNEAVDEIRASPPVREYATVAFLPPLVTLVLGLLGTWVVSGFARKGAGPLQG
jgi:hypothetical protein